MTNPWYCSAPGGLPPAIFAVVIPARIPVHAAGGGAGNVTLAARRAVASPRKLDRARCRAVSAGSDEVHRAAQRVPAEERAVAREDLDPVDVVHGKEIEIDLRGLRLVHPHTVEEDGDPLREADDR